VRKIIFYCLCSVVLLLPVAAQARVAATAYSVVDNGDFSRFALEVSGSASYKLFTLDKPDRLVIDLKDTVWKSEQTSLPLPSNLVRAVRHGVKDGTDLRIVLDLVQPVNVKSSSYFPGKDGKPNRIILDIGTKKPPALTKPAGLPAKAALPEPPKAPEAAVPSLPPQASPHILVVPTVPKASKQSMPSVTPPALQEPAKKPASIIQKPLIILDPGHGGDDPGAIGRNYKTFEKNVTLSYARALKKQLEKTKRYRVEMTRSSDNFIRLEDRVNKARERQADIFISLHADSHPHPSMRGLSVYTLSETASDKEAEALAAKENKSDIIKGVDLKDASSEVATILIDLKQRETKNNSAEFAEVAVSELQKNVTVVKNTHRFAGFRVLKGIDVPAVLVELGYLSNRTEEKLLNSAAYRKKVIDALVTSIDKHFSLHKLERVDKE
jgi:N-acetylmuramoyl-L-alanine amidase